MGGFWSSSEVVEDAESAARQTGGTHPRGGPAEGLSDAIFLAGTRRGRDATRCRWASGAGADTRIDDTNFAGEPIPVEEF